jgi:DNA-binding transcriptional regulator GbsR (MarR family)
MPQHDVALYLERHKGQKFTVPQLAKLMRFSKGSVASCVSKLCQFHIIQSEIVTERRYFKLEGRKIPQMRTVRKIWV